MDFRQKGGTKIMNDWVDKLIIEYEDGRKGLNDMKEQLGDSELDKLDKTQLNGMINDMSYSIEWMKKGRRPGNLRGIDKRSAYQRRILLDMELFPSIDIQPKPRELTEVEKKAIINILVDLSHRERQCYLMHFANGWSLQEIANELNISKSTVQKYLERSKNKISCRTNAVHSLARCERDII